MLDPVKSKIAQRAREMGFRFDESEIIDVVDDGRRVVFLRSIKATRQIELPDGTIVDEEFNDPIIWLEYPSPGLTRCEPDYERRVLNYTFYLPKLHARCPELIHVAPTSHQSA